MAWYVAMDSVGMQNLGNALVSKAGLFKQLTLSILNILRFKFDCKFLQRVK